jgi:hypothetical protein
MIELIFQVFVIIVIMMTVYTTICEPSPVDVCLGPEVKLDVPAFKDNVIITSDCMLSCNINMTSFREFAF